MQKTILGLTLALLFIYGCDSAGIGGRVELQENTAASELDAAAKKSSSQVETLILFDPNVPETPESIVFDRQDNAYITMAFIGEIRKIAPDLTQSTLTFMPLGAPCVDPSRVTVALGLAFDLHDQLYVAISACDPANLELVVAGSD